jgi:hypothetical protein
LINNLPETTAISLPKGTRDLDQIHRDLLVLLNFICSTPKGFWLVGTSLAQASATHSINPGIDVQKVSNLNLGLTRGVLRGGASGYGSDQMSKRIEVEGWGRHELPPNLGCRRLDQSGLKLGFASY